MPQILAAMLGIRVSKNAFSIRPRCDHPTRIRKYLSADQWILGTRPRMTSGEAAPLHNSAPQRKHRYQLIPAANHARKISKINLPPPEKSYPRSLAGPHTPLIRSHKKRHRGAGAGAREYRTARDRRRSGQRA